jgi:hypothetical protein
MVHVKPWLTDEAEDIDFVSLEVKAFINPPYHPTRLVKHRSHPVTYNIHRRVIHHLEIRGDMIRYQFLTAITVGNTPRELCYHGIVPP